jgi:hypothetical protein
MNGLAKLIPICGALFCGTAIGWVAAFVAPGGHRDYIPATKTQLSPRASGGQSAENSAEASDEASLSPDSPEFLHEFRAALSLIGKAESEAQLSELVDRLDLTGYPINKTRILFGNPEPTFAPPAPPLRKRCRRFALSPHSKTSPRMSRESGGRKTVLPDGGDFKSSEPGLFNDYLPAGLPLDTRSRRTCFDL